MMTSFNPKSGKQIILEIFLYLTYTLLGWGWAIEHSRPEQNGLHGADDTFSCIFLRKFVCAPNVTVIHFQKSNWQ